MPDFIYGAGAPMCQASWIGNRGWCVNQHLQPRLILCIARFSQHDVCMQAQGRKRSLELFNAYGACASEILVDLDAAQVKPLCKLGLRQMLLKQSVSEEDPQLAPERDQDRPVAILYRRLWQGYGLVLAAELGFYVGRHSLAQELHGFFFFCLADLGSKADIRHVANVSAVFFCYLNAVFHFELQWLSRALVLLYSFNQKARLANT